MVDATSVSTPKANEHLVLYEIEVAALTLSLGGGRVFDATSLLHNGRASYLLFEKLVGRLAGLEDGSQGGDSDLRDGGLGVEVKAYHDPGLFPAARHERFHTAASSTFGPNNRGPEVTRLVRAGNYRAALQICRETGYDKNAAYVYTNTAEYDVSVPLRYIIVPTTAVLDLLDDRDPRLISRTEVLGLATRTERL